MAIPRSVKVAEVAEESQCAGCSAARSSLLMDWISSAAMREAQYRGQAPARSGVPYPCQNERMAAVIDSH